MAESPSTQAGTAQPGTPQAGPVATSAAATGKRKSAIARVTLKLGTGNFVVNAIGTYDVAARISGGGVTGQAGALRHGIARALENLDVALRPPLKRSGFLTRDARKKERKKYGQRGARARFQFSKR